MARDNDKPRRAKIGLMPAHLVTREWFDHMVRTGRGTVTIICTPEIAGWALVYNIGNRPLSQSHIDEIAWAISEGRYANTHHPWLFTEDNIMGDGQHRAYAIIKADIPVEIDICFGVPDEVLPHVDTGRKRSAADELGRRGYSHPGMSAAIAKGLYWHLRGQSTAKNGLSSDLVGITIEDHPFILDIASILRNSKFAPIRKSWCGVVLAIIRLTNSQEKVEKFIDHISRRVGGEDDPAVRLHVRLTNISASRRKETLAQQMAAFMHAWNAWVDDRRIKRLQGVTKGDERKTALIPAALIARPDR